MAGLQGFHHLVHGADQHEGRLENLFDGELGPLLLELFGRLAPVIRDDASMAAR